MKDIDATKLRDDGFYSAICYVLGYLNGNNNCCSTMYIEIVEAVEEGKLIAYARKNGEMNFTGLNIYIRYKKTRLLP